MSDRLHTATDMAGAELTIREALSASSPGGRLDAIMLRYWHMVPAQRDALFAVLAARVTLVAPSSIRSVAAGASAEGVRPEPPTLIDSNTSEQREVA